ncbi:MAG: arginine deiminase [Actinomycetaceae bacterium]|nr:arginine deiminase [Actinomycetaceae bacterium]
MNVGVYNDVDKLERVIVHRPGPELDRLTPANVHRLLFDDLLWPKQARREHDQFTKALTDRGIEVLYFNELLSQVLAVDAAREFVIPLAFREEVFGPTAAAMLTEYARGLAPEQLAHLLTAGITRRELEATVGAVPTTWTTTLEPDDFVVPCLPNLYFMRDTSTWIHAGVSINPMHMRARRRESVLLEAIYRWHPAFAPHEFPRWNTVPASRRATFEGGDIIVPGEGAVFVGISERTTAAGFEQLATSLLQGDESIRQVVAVLLDESRESMHLDTVMSMVDNDTFVLYPGLGERTTVTATRGASTPGEDGFSLRAESHLPGQMRQVLASAVGQSQLNFIAAPTSAHIAEWGLWNAAFNLLALAPRVVVAYDRNERMNDFLSDQGVEVVAIPSGELARGHGGPRCMSCPVYRSAT